MADQVQCNDSPSPPHSQEAQYQVSDRNVQVTLAKEDEEWWPHLTREKTKLSWLRVSWEGGVRMCFCCWRSSVVSRHDKCLLISITLLLLMYYHFCYLTKTPSRGSTRYLVSTCRSRV